MRARLLLLMATMPWFLSNNVFALEPGSVNEKTSFNGYCDDIRDKLSLNVSRLSQYVESDDYRIRHIQFGPMLRDFKANTLFVGGPVLNLDENCFVILQDMKYEKKTSIQSFKSLSDYEPVADGWMLHNCGLPWANWYIYGSNEVNRINVLEVNFSNNGFKILSEKQRKDLQDEVKRLRKQNITNIKEGELLEKTNCDCVSVVNLPHPEKIKFMDTRMLPVNIHKNIDKHTDCYGIEYFKISSSDSYKMLLFINKKSKKNIHDYLYMLSNSISYVQ